MRALGELCARSGCAWFGGVLLAGALGGCPGNVQRPVAGGTFKLRDQALTLAVDRKASTLTLTGAGTAAVQRTFTARDKKRWFVDCRMNMKAHTLEVLEVAGGPLKVGTVTLEKPLVVASCGESGVWLATQDAQGEPVKEPMLVFDATK